MWIWLSLDVDRAQLCVDWAQSGCGLGSVWVWVGLSLGVDRVQSGCGIGLSLGVDRA